MGNKGQIGYSSDVTDEESTGDCRPNADLAIDQPATLKFRASFVFIERVDDYASWHKLKLRCDLRLACTPEFPMYNGCSPGPFPMG
jgi:hypothetical protein